MIDVALWVEARQGESSLPGLWPYVLSEETAPQTDDMVIDDGQDPITQGTNIYFAGALVADTTSILFPSAFMKPLSPILAGSYPIGLSLSFSFFSLPVLRIILFLLEMRLLLSGGSVPLLSIERLWPRKMQDDGPKDEHVHSGNGLLAYVHPDSGRCRIRTATPNLLPHILHALSGSMPSCTYLFPPYKCMCNPRYLRCIDTTGRL